MQYSDNGSTWSTAATGFVPSQLGWNSKTWSSAGAHRYWRLYLTNAPGPGPWLNELQFLVNWDWTYGYDDFNRLLTAGGVTQGFSYAYDRFGNRWNQTVTAGTGNNTSFSFDANNRITQLGLDAPGNVTSDGVHSYTWDAEGRLVTVDGGSTASYLYDAEGRRFRSTVGSTARDYVYDLGGNVIFEANPTGNTWTRGEVYAGSAHLATYSGGPSGTTVFAHTNWLSTERVRTAMDGSTSQSCTSTPFGDGQSCYGSDASPLHFTGQQHDSESNLEHFWFRKYSSTQGRWMSPDPAGLAAVDLTNPQSLNRYAYALNSPTNYIDPLGTDVADPNDYTLCQLFGMCGGWGGWGGGGGFGSAAYEVWAGGLQS